MSKIFTITIVLILCINIANGQTPTVNLKHLTKGQYIKQIEQCSDSAYIKKGVQNPHSIYDDDSYDWIVKVINNIIDKDFTSKISHNNEGDNDISYKVVYSSNSENKSIFFSLAFYNKDQFIGQTKILYGQITDNSIRGIIKIFNCKKEIKKILELK